MTSNRSLDDFADGSDASVDGTSDAPASDEGSTDGAGSSTAEADSPTARDDSTARSPPDETGEAEDADAGTPGPVASTYVWTRDGGSCATCGETAEERWRDGDDLVCVDCKAW